MVRNLFDVETNAASVGASVGAGLGAKAGPVGAGLGAGFGAASGYIAGALVNPCPASKVLPDGGERTDGRGDARTDRETDGAARTPRRVEIPVTEA